jgi:hypothetical protein
LIKAESKEYYEGKIDMTGGKSYLRIKVSGSICFTTTKKRKNHEKVRIIE